MWYLRTILLLFLTFSFSSLLAQPPVQVNIQPAVKDGIFSYKSPVQFNVRIDNTGKTVQTGVINYVLTTTAGAYVLEGTTEISIKAGASAVQAIRPSVEASGSYELTLRINLTDFNEAFVQPFTYEAKLDKEQKKQEEAQKKIEAALEDENAEIVTTLRPLYKNALFSAKNPVKYNLVLHNKYDVKQEGKVNYQVTTETGEWVCEYNLPVSLPKKTIRQYNFDIPDIKKPGIYKISLRLNLSYYDDTTRHAFIYELDQVQSEENKPDDFDDFWDRTIKELELIDPEYEVIPAVDKDISTHHVYRVEFMSLDKVKVYGWLSVPKLRGRYPVLVAYGGYRKLLEPIYFPDFAVLSMMPRGVGDYEKKINPTNQELITLGIEDREKYIYRGIYMDCLRAVDFFFSNAHLFKFDLSRVGVFGGSQGGSLALVVSALIKRTGKRVNTCMSDTPVFCDFDANLTIAEKAREMPPFPIGYIVKYINESKTVSKEKILNNLKYYAVKNFVPDIDCSVLYAATLLDDLAPPGCTIPTYNRLNEKVRKSSELYVFHDLGHEVPESYNNFKSTWFFEKLARSIRQPGN
jgi:cephalosporin-C deacetylase-like acetyl esterase